VDLNFAHIHGACADALQQRDTAAGRPFVVGGDEPFQVRTVFHHHLAVGAEAAGGTITLLVATVTVSFSSVVRRTPVTSPFSKMMSLTEVSSITSMLRLLTLRTRPLIR
jgi:hypothetical protein